MASIALAQELSALVVGTILCGCGYRVTGDRAQAECAALALLIGRKRCGTWRMSHARYQSGRCVPTTPVTHRYVRAVTWALAAIRAFAAPGAAAGDVEVDIALASLT